MPAPFLAALLGTSNPDAAATKRPTEVSLVENPKAVYDTLNTSPEMARAAQDYRLAAQQAGANSAIMLASNKGKSAGKPPAETSTNTGPSQAEIQADRENPVLTKILFKLNNQPDKISAMETVVTLPDQKLWEKMKAGEPILPGERISANRICEKVFRYMNENGRLDLGEVTNTEEKAIARLLTAGAAPGAGESAVVAQGPVSHPAQPAPGVALRTLSREDAIREIRGMNDFLNHDIGKLNIELPSDTGQKLIPKMTLAVRPGGLESLSGPELQECHQTFLDGVKIVLNKAGDQTLNTVSSRDGGANTRISYAKGIVAAGACQVFGADVGGGGAAPSNYQGAGVGRELTQQEWYNIRLALENRRYEAGTEIGIARQQLGFVQSKWNFDNRVAKDHLSLINYQIDSQKKVRDYDFKGVDIATKDTIDLGKQYDQANRDHKLSVGELIMLGAKGLQAGLKQKRAVGENNKHENLSQGLMQLQAVTLAKLLDGFGQQIYPGSANDPCALQCGQIMSVGGARLTSAIDKARSGGTVDQKEYDAMAQAYKSLLESKGTQGAFVTYIDKTGYNTTLAQNQSQAMTAKR